MRTLRLHGNMNQKLHRSLRKRLQNLKRAATAEKSGPLPGIMVAATIIEIGEEELTDIILALDRAGAPERERKRRG